MGNIRISLEVSCQKKFDHLMDAVTNMQAHKKRDAALQDDPVVTHERISNRILKL